MTTKRQASTGTTPQVAEAKKSRTPEAQDVFRARWNTAMERLAR